VQHSEPEILVRPAVSCITLHYPAVPCSSFLQYPQYPNLTLQYPRVLCSTQLSLLARAVPTGPTVPCSTHRCCRGTQLSLLPRAVPTVPCSIHEYCAVPRCIHSTHSTHSTLQYPRVLCSTQIHLQYPQYPQYPSAVPTVPGLPQYPRVLCSTRQGNHYMTNYNSESAEVFHEFKLRVSIHELANVTTESPQTIRSRMQQLWVAIRNIYFIETDAERHARVTAQLRLEIAKLTARLKRPRSPEPSKAEKHPKHYDEENKG
jgi:hypothetical protein